MFVSQNCYFPGLYYGENRYIYPTRVRSRYIPVAAGFLEFLCFRFAFELTRSIGLVAVLVLVRSPVVVKYFRCFALPLPMGSYINKQQLFAVLHIAKVFFSHSIAELAQTEPASVSSSSSTHNFFRKPREKGK